MELALGRYAWASPWVRACALRAIDSSTPGGIAILARAATDSEALVAETATHALAATSGGEGARKPARYPTIDKVIVLLTDGTNTQNRWTSSASSIDSRTQKLCDNLRSANVKVYTVRVIDGNGTLLKNCATKPDMYYDVDEAVQLNSVFSSIAQNLANLRITK